MFSGSNPYPPLKHICTTVTLQKINDLMEILNNNIESSLFLHYNDRQIWFIRVFIKFFIKLKI